VEISSLKVVYIAHPLGAGEDRQSNLARAARWVAWAATRKNVAPVADWIVLASQLSEELRQLGLQIDCSIVERCDELWLVGGRVSPGMVVERDHARACGVRVVDLTGLGEEPPEGASNER